MSARALFGLVVLALTARYYLSKKQGKVLPGPPGIPILGNTLQVPPIKQWLYYFDLSKIYGPLFQLSLGGDTVIVLNKMEDANELLNKRSGNYSSRPPSVYASKYQSQSRRFVFLPYNNDLKRFRQAFHQMLQAHIPGSYEHIQNLESIESLKRLVDSSTSSSVTPFQNAKRYAGSLIYHLTYGKRLSPENKNEDDLQGIIDVLDNMVRESQPGVHLVDTFPILDLLPSWTGLANWRSKALQGHEREMQLYGRLIQEVKTSMDGNNPNLECFGARGWEQSKKLMLDDKGMAYLGGTSFEAGTGTLAGALLWFFSAALLYPDAIRKAQQEIDNLLGPDGETMPGFEHFNELRWCYAVVKETMRWQPSVPAGVPHTAEKDDVYKGYTIEKNTIFISNIYAMHHDPEDFPDPYTFKPERWKGDWENDSALNTEKLLDGHVTFGFGRRICPGRRLGATSFWLAVVRWIWAFDILPLEDEVTGQPILPLDLRKCTSGITSEPEEFPLQLKLRTPGHSKTITHMYNQVVSREGL